MNDYRYILTPYKGPSTRYRCPSCNEPRKFSLYIDKETGDPLADNVGRCDRQDRCGHHYSPRQYFIDNPQQTKQPRAVAYRATIMQAAPHPVEYLPIDLVKASHRNFEQNHLWVFFAAQMGEAAANAIFDKYMVGTSKHWPGATAFWQVDHKNRPRQCKVILYNPTTGRRVKQDGQSYIAFMGKKLLGNPDAVLQQCFFGSHLLPLYPLAPVALTESEKTAMYCAHFYPNYVWLATGGKQGCRWTEKAVFEVLKGRIVVLFPDLMATADWQAKAEKVKAMVSCKIHVSTDLEAMASDAEKAAGLDLMDYLLQQGTTQPRPIDGPVIGSNGYPASWDEITPIQGSMPTARQPQAAASNTPCNEPQIALNEYYTLQWFVDEAERSFKKDMGKNIKEFYPAFIASYSPTLRKVGINENELRRALNL